MSERIGDDPRHHPELVTWLNERAAAFEDWAQATGMAERWDFGTESMEALEDLVRRTFADEEDLLSARSEPFVQGAVWYVGEMLCRHKGATWAYDPWSPDSDDPPRMFTPEQRAVDDTPYVIFPDFDEDDDEALAEEDRMLFPLGTLTMLYWSTDELDNPIDVHLADLLDDEHLRDLLDPES